MQTVDTDGRLPEWLARLRELALNLRWTWDRETRALFPADHRTAASALGVPLGGVSLFYQEGYGRQVLDASGWQLDRFPSNKFEAMPVRVERNADGWPLTVQVPLPGRPLSLLVWRV